MSAGAPEFDSAAYQDELRKTREALASAEVVGWPRRGAELDELKRLIAKYPSETRELLAGVERK